MLTWLTLCNLCVLCASVVSKVLRKPSPQRHRDLRRSTEKVQIRTPLKNVYPCGAATKTFSENKKLRTAKQSCSDTSPDQIRGTASIGSTVIDRKLDMRTNPGATPFGLDRNFLCV